MSPATLTTTAAPSAAVQHQPWCAEHWDSDSVCWAPDIALRIDPAAGDNRGRITVMMTHNPNPNPRCGGQPRNLTLFIDRFADRETGVDMSPDEAEIAAHAMLAMTALSRGQTHVAEQHRAIAEQAAAVLLGSREGGPVCGGGCLVCGCTPSACAAGCGCTCCCVYPYPLPAVTGGAR